MTPVWPWRVAVAIAAQVSVEFDAKLAFASTIAQAMVSAFMAAASVRKVRLSVGGNSSTQEEVVRSSQQLALCKEW